MKKQAPATWKGKKLLCEEIHRSMGPQESDEDAMKQLKKIRELYPETLGWVELDSDIEYYNGGFHAVVYHARYG